MKCLCSLLILLLFIACNGKDTSSGAIENSTAPIQNEATTTKFMDLVNNHRKSMGLKPLTHADELASIAEAHSLDMANKSVAFGHTGFSSRCTDARSVMDGGNLCAENVAMGQTTPEAVFTAWMNSPSHRANIENARLTHCGLGIGKSADGTLYWTHFFLEKN